MKAPENGHAALGILGGTFDPVHLAHLTLASRALFCLPLQQVLWIPAGQPWHRERPGALPEQRLAMVRAAIATEPRFVLDDSEVMDAAPGYTVDTLERLRRQHGDERPLVLLMGADAFHGLERWHRWRDILSLAHVAVATRPGFPLQDFSPALAAEYRHRRPASADFQDRPAGRIFPFELSAGTVSATGVRAALAAGAPEDTLRTLLPASVLDYIRQHHLYSA